MIENASLSTQRLLRADLATAAAVADKEGLTPPAIVVIGDGPVSPKVPRNWFDATAGGTFVSL